MVEGPEGVYEEEAELLGERAGWTGGGGRRLCDTGKDWRIHTQSRFVEHLQQGSNSRNVYVGHGAHLANLQCIQ